MTLSPPSRDENIISMRMKGSSLIRRQLSMGPPIGVKALSTSAAVVPLAKFCAITQYGPARPLMAKEVVLAAAAAGLTLTCCATSGSVSMRSRALASLDFRLAASFLTEGAFGCVMRLPRDVLGCRRDVEETERWRSCVHSALMLPLGRAAGAAMGVGAGRWPWMVACQCLVIVYP